MIKLVEKWLYSNDVVILIWKSFLDLVVSILLSVNRVSDQLAVILNASHYFSSYVIISVSIEISFFIMINIVPVHGFE